MKLGIRSAALVGGMFIAVFAAGCGAPSGGTPKHTVQGCEAYGLHAIEHHITVTWKPAPCQGLSKAEVNQAVALAVVRAAGDARKAIRRKRAGEAAPYLEHLVSALPPGASAAPTGTRSPTRRGRDLPMGIAALIAWLVAAGSGAYLLGSWMARGGSLRRPARGAGTGSPPTLLFGHFGLALCGLASWVAYLVTDWAALAWVAVAALLPVAGLGMATLVTGLQTRRAAPPQGNSDESEAGEGGIATDGTAAVQVADAGAGTSGSTRIATIGASSAGTGGTGTVSVRARLAPLVVAAHGVLAVTTMILVLLAALGAAAS